MDALESQLLIEQSKVKSPGFAAILSFFFPAFGAFYTRKIIAAVIYIIIDVINFAMVIVGIGVITGFLFRLIAAFLAYGWAREINRAALQQIIAKRRPNVP
jgi:uncharacterized membrane protein (DUF106 family)